MSHRIFNFSAGPAMLPTEVLEKSAAALLDYQGKGFGIATDIRTGPNGHLFVSSLSNGAVYEILRRAEEGSEDK